MLIHTEDKLKAAESFIKSIKLQLSVRPANPDHHQKFIENDFYQINKVCYFLNAVVFELIVKIFYEIDNNKECPRHHNLKNIYKELSGESQKFVKDKYEELKKETENFLRVKNDDSSLELSYADFQKVLKTNGEIVMHRKYDMKLDSNNAVFNNMVVFEGSHYTIPYSICEKIFSEILNKIKAHS